MTKIRKLFNRKLLLLAVIFLIFAELILIVKSDTLPLSSLIGPKLKQNEIAAIAKIIVNKCSNAQYHPSCYDREIPKLTDDISMEDAFKVTSVVQDEDKSYTYCHILGHELSAREVSKDPSRWRDVLTRCPSGECSNGCLHGGLQEKFRGEVSLTDHQIEGIIPDLQTLCEPRNTWNPTALEKSSCYHALGHMTMYMTNADIKKSLALCNRVGLKGDGRDYTQLCYDGVFMQIYQPLEPEDFTLVRGKQPTKNTVTSFCSKYDLRQQASCQSESWPLFRDQILSSEGVVDFCKNAPPGFEDRCLGATFYVAAVQFNLDTSKILSYCSGIKLNNIRSQCFANGASRLIEVDYRNISKAMDLCRSAEKNDPQGRCYQEMINYSSYNFHHGSRESMEVCNSLPLIWKATCVEASRRQT